MFHPFKAVHYALNQQQHWDRIFTPPYDVLSEAEKAEYKSFSPQNFAHLDVPGSDYAGAGNLLREWMRAGILTQDADPSLLLYELSFIWRGERYSRLGVVGVLDLEPPQAKIVLPHEKTLPHHRKDRLALMEATGAQLSSILVMCRDPGFRMGELWSEWISAARPVADWVDRDGHRHVISQVFEQPVFAQMDQILEDGGGQVLILDGHHRYATALELARKRHEQGTWNRVLACMTSMEDPGMLSCATHRFIHGLPDFSGRYQKLKTQLKATGWQETSRGSIEELLLQVEKTKPAENAFALVEGNAQQGSVWIRERPDREPDVCVMERELFCGPLGMSEEDLSSARYLQFIKGTGPEVVEKALKDPQTQLGFLMRPVHHDEVFNWAAEGKLMPQKSTFFYPKIASGFAVHMLTP